MNTITYEELVELSAETYLCEPLPDSFLEWACADQNGFIEDNAWEPFEYWAADDIWSSIITTAESIKDFLQSKNITITEE